MHTLFRSRRLGGARVLFPVLLLLMGGVPLPRAAAQDPAVVGQWTGPFPLLGIRQPQPLVQQAILAIHTTLLPSGKVLIWDRTANAEFGLGAPDRADAYLWDPNPLGSLSEQTWASGTPVFVNRTNVFCAGHALLADGRLLAAGGNIAVNRGENETNFFDYITESWSAGPDMVAGPVIGEPPLPGRRWYPSNCTLADGEMLTISGYAWDDDPAVNPPLPVVNNVPEVFSPEAGAWRALTNITQPVPYYPWTFLVPEPGGNPQGRVFVAGPAKPTFFLDTGGTGAVTPGPSSNFGTPPVNPVYGLQVSRNEGTAVLYDHPTDDFDGGRVLIVGGGGQNDLAQIGDGPTDTAEVINLNDASPAWRFTGIGGQTTMAYARRHLNATLLPDGQVLVTCGTRSPLYNEVPGAVLAAEMWDPVTEAWTTMASMQEPRLYHSTALLLPDGRVLVGGGEDDASATGNRPTVEIFSPPYLFDVARPTIADAPAAVGYAETFTVQTPDSEDIDRVSWVRLGSVTHSFDMNQRINFLAFEKVQGALQVTAPANGTLCPPGHYMLFIHKIGTSKNLIPSVARIIQIQ